MLTMAGSKMATRVAPSLLKAAGADELIVDSLEDYEELAVSLATDPERLFEVSSDTTLKNNLGTRKKLAKGFSCVSGVPLRHSSRKGRWR